MIRFNQYVDKGLLKKRPPNFTQINRQIERANKDLKTFDLVVKKDPEWASTIAYQAMLRAGRALIFAHGFLPIDGQQHKTVVEVTGGILDKKFELLINQFNKLRKKRNIFFYDSIDKQNFTEAKNAIKTAKELIKAIGKKIKDLNPQTQFSDLPTFSWGKEGDNTLENIDKIIYK